MKSQLALKAPNPLVQLIAFALQHGDETHLPWSSPNLSDDITTSADSSSK